MGKGSLTMALQYVIDGEPGPGPGKAVRHSMLSYKWLG